VLTNLHVLVRGLLPFSCHGLWLWAGGDTCEPEEGAGGGEAVEGVADDLPGLPGRSLGAWAVCSEGDPVSWWMKLLAFSICKVVVDKGRQAPGYPGKSKSSSYLSRILAKNLKGAVGPN
jgi:hypothetical protein